MCLLWPMYTMRYRTRKILPFHHTLCIKLSCTWYLLRHIITQEREPSRVPIIARTIKLENTAGDINILSKPPGPSGPNPNTSQYYVYERTSSSYEHIQVYRTHIHKTHSLPPFLHLSISISPSPRQSPPHQTSLYQHHAKTIHTSETNGSKIFEEKKY